MILRPRPQEYTMEVYLRQYWTDPRLQFADEIPHVESLSIPDVYYRDVWTPGQWWGISPGDHCWDYCPGTLSSKSSNCKSFEDWVPT